MKTPEMIIASALLGMAILLIGMMVFMLGERYARRELCESLELTGSAVVGVSDTETWTITGEVSK